MSNPARRAGRSRYWAALHLAMREADINKSELARHMDLDEKEARRILDLHHATQVPTIDRALRALGKRVEVRGQ